MSGQWYSEQELLDLGVVHVGRGVRVSRRAAIHGADQVSLGDEVRIDDFCVLTGRLTVGSHVHIAPFCGLYGRASISIGDFANLSSRVAIYSTSDDFSGRAMTNPTIPDEFTDVLESPVALGRHTIVGCGSVILPGVTVGEGAAVGALSLVKRDLLPWGCYAGIPTRRTGDRSNDLLALEAAFRSRHSGSATELN